MYLNTPELIVMDRQVSYETSIVLFPATVVSRRTVIQTREKFTGCDYYGAKNWQDKLNAQNSNMSDPPYGDIRLQEIGAGFYDVTAIHSVYGFWQTISTSGK